MLLKKHKLWSSTGNIPLEYYDSKNHCYRSFPLIFSLKVKWPHIYYNSGSISYAYVAYEKYI